MEKEIEKKVMNLERKPLDELRKIWKKVFVEEAPRYSKKYLIPRLASDRYKTCQTRKKLLFSTFLNIILRRSASAVIAE